jgi:hypothetical protein
MSKLFHNETEDGIKDSLYITPPGFMKFCPVVPEICRGQVHGPRKERKENNNNNNNNNNIL